MAKKRRRRKKRKSFLQKLGIACTIFLILVVLGIGAATILFQVKTGENLLSCVAQGIRTTVYSTSTDFTTRESSMIYSSDGQLIAELSETSDSTYVTYDHIPQNVVNAFVAVEDRTFWTNSGINVKGMVRVLGNYVLSGGKEAAGASTITQQLVKLTYLTSEKSMNRKVKEIVIALGITKKYSKEEIMEYYCNICCFANGIYGIEDAARAYFGRSASELTLSECAYLCAIPNRPEYYNPRSNPQNAIERRDKILKDMLGEGYITQAEYEAALSEDVAAAVIVAGESAELTNAYHNYETTYAVQCAIRYLMDRSDDFSLRYEFSSEEDYQNYRAMYTEVYEQMKHELYTGGYVIETTLDLNKQAELQAILDQTLSDQTTRLEDGIYQVQGSMTVIDNETGKVICAIGGRSQEETQGIYTLNRTFQGYQQPGSSIKPLIVYAPALDSGEFDTNSLLVNVNVEEGKTMSESQIVEMGGEQVSLRTAVENSLNGCAYWTFAKLGIRNNLSYLHKMNFGRILPDDYNMSACLGGLSYGVTTEEMANAYYTLYNDGKFTDTDCLKSMVNKYGVEVYEQAKAVEVYKEETSTKITDVMKGVLTSGTAAGSSWYSNTAIEAAGKTGTTNDSKAAWFCGYTPYYTIAVWVGCDTPTEIAGLSGSSYPLSIWKQSMLNLISDKPVAFFTKVKEEPVPEEEKVCICTVKCTGEHTDEDCPVCKEDLTKCVGEEEKCTCSQLCYGDGIDETCPICLKDPTLCEGLVPDCTCEKKCTEEERSDTCIACLLDLENCLGAEEIVIPSDPEPMNPDSIPDGGQGGESQEPEPLTPDSPQETSGGDSPEPTADTPEPASDYPEPTGELSE